MRMTRSCALILSVSWLLCGRAESAFITTNLQQSIASDNPFPGDGGTHFHSAPGQAVEVGSFDLEEEVRGVAEFNLAGQMSSSAILSFNVARIGSSYFGQAGPGNYTIQVIAYMGNNAISLADYSAAPLATLGSFSTASLVLGQTFSFDASAAYRAVLGSGSLGIRLQVGSNPGDNVANQFSGFRLETNPTAIPEPAGLVMIAGALPFLAGFALGRNKAR
jgi:hypothetical protein